MSPPPEPASITEGLGALTGGRGGGLPLWYQVGQSLRAYIADRAGGEPVRLPTENALAAHYGVSVATVRQALAGLEADGLVSRHRRRGTFATPKAREDRALHLLGSADAVFAQQASDEVRLLGRGTGPVPPALARWFPGVAEVAVFRRLRYERGAVLSYAENFVPLPVADRILDADLVAAPMTMVLRDVLGLTLARIENAVEARTAPPQLAGLLGLAPADPVLLSTNVVFDAGGAVVDVALIHYRGDRFRFTVSVELS